MNTQPDNYQMGGPPTDDEAERDEAIETAATTTTTEVADGGQFASSTVAALPPDPEAYDSERNAHARARGLAAPYIAGGRDPAPEKGRNEERFYGKLLLAMVGLIVFGGFALGIISNLLGLSGLVGQ